MCLVTDSRRCRIPSGTRGTARTAFPLLLCTGSQALSLPHHFLRTALLLRCTQIVSIAAGEGEMETKRERQSALPNGYQLIDLTIRLL